MSSELLATNAGNRKHKRETRSEASIKWRVKHVPAKTIYTIQCHDVLTLTYPLGAAVHPDDAGFVASAVRTDAPDHWELCGETGGCGWIQSSHETKEAARAALHAIRLAPKPAFHISMESEQLRLN